jgi:hypothetical protein
MSFVVILNPSNRGVHSLAVIVKLVAIEIGLHPIESVNSGVIPGLVNGVGHN